MILIQTCYYCSTCRKLVGVRFFSQGSDALFSSARDTDGHGSHTLSTAGGNFVDGVNVFGNGNGTAKGGSPKAHVAAYKVCWPIMNTVSCYFADILAGFEAAISDGVDVISVSLGGRQPEELFSDPISIGSFHAVSNGIVVVSSAGNRGPYPGTISNVAPWLFTVAASTTDRDFTSYVKLGDKKKLKVLPFFLFQVNALHSRTNYPKKLIFWMSLNLVHFALSGS